MKKIIVLGLIVLVAVMAFLTLKKDGGQSETDDTTVAIPTSDPIDDAMGFYSEWLRAAKAPDFDPVALELTASPKLTARMQESLTRALGENSEIDPVLCQTQTPEKIGTKLIAQKDGVAKIMVIARGEKMPGQAIVTLVPKNDMWAIDEIKCSYGETAPQTGEFSFEQEGQLLHSVPPPLDPDYWYLVYEVDGVMGYTAKLIFDNESTCSEGGETGTCDVSTFEETNPAFVQGEMSETGLVVKHLELR